MKDWAYTLRPMRTRQLVNPHASMKVPVADLKRAPGGKGSKGGSYLLILCGAHTTPGGAGIY